MSMRERAELLRGTLELDSELGRGTTVRVRIPRGTLILPACHLCQWQSLGSIATLPAPAPPLRLEMPSC